MGDPTLKVHMGAWWGRALQAHLVQVRHQRAISSLNMVPIVSGLNLVTIFRYKNYHLLALNAFGA